MRKRRKSGKDETTTSGYYHALARTLLSIAEETPDLVLRLRILNAAIDAEGVSWDAYVAARTPQQLEAERIALWGPRYAER